jgi:cell division protein FtsX
MAVMVPGFTSNPYGGNANSYITVITIGAIAVFFTVLLLISIVTGLGAAQRRERFATLRLIGASAQIISRIAAIEIAVPSLIGALLGVALDTLLRPLAAQVPVNGTRLFPEDLTTGWVGPLAVVWLTVTASAEVAAYRTSRAGIGPLGVTRTVHEKVLLMWRIVSLLAGLAAMITATVLIRILHVRIPWLELLLLIGGFALVLAGIVVIGPWLTLLVSRTGLRVARSASGVIAASRIAKTPVATFRSVSGLVIAVFVVSVFAGASSIIQTTQVPEARPGLLQPTSLHATVGDGHSSAKVTDVAQHAVGRTGIQSAVIGYAKESFSEGSVPEIHIRATDASSLGFEDTPETGLFTFDSSFLYFWTTQPMPLKPAPSNDLQDLVPVVMVVGTEGRPKPWTAPVLS